MPMSNKGKIALLFVALATWRLYYALTLPILDCDETFNYWEPAFAVLQQQKSAFEPISYFGKQTWEYAPEFALRSWLFVWLYAAPGYVARFVYYAIAGSSNTDRSLEREFLNDTVVLYFICKCALALAATAVELYFVVAVGYRFSSTLPSSDVTAAQVKGTAVEEKDPKLSSKPFSVINVATLMAFVVVGSSAGTTQAAVSFLPSSFATLCSYAALGSWLIYDQRGRCGAALIAFIKKSLNDSLINNATTKVAPTAAETSRRQKEFNQKKDAIYQASASLPLLAGLIIPVAASAIVGWPFAALVSVPIALDVLYHDGIFRPLFVSIQSVLVLGVAVLAFDVLYYQKIVWSPWQLVAYNVFGGADRGPELYGVEPWNFFFKNLFLNFNFIFIMAMASPLIILLAPTYAQIGRNNHPTAKSGQQQGGDMAEVLDEAVARRLKQLKEERAKEKGGFGYFNDEGKGGQKQHKHIVDGSAAPSDMLPLPLTRGRLFLYTSPYFLWFIFWLRIPHKEERFMAPAYPYLVLAGVIGLLTVGRAGSQCFYINVTSNAKHNGFLSKASSGLLSAMKKLSIVSANRSIHLLSVVALVMVSLSATISQLRLLGIAANYGGLQAAALSTRGAIAASVSSQVATSKRPQSTGNSAVRTLCVGVDWYRYPGSFFLPPSTNAAGGQQWQYCFLKTKAFSGALPMNFKSKGIQGGGYQLDASAPRPDMNDLNKEVLPHQYCSSVDVCDAIMDTAESSFAGREEWSIVDGTITSDSTRGTYERLGWERTSAIGDSVRKGPSPLSSLWALANVLLPDSFEAKHTSLAILDGDSPFVTCRALWLLGFKREKCLWRPVVVLVRKSTGEATSPRAADRADRLNDKVVVEDEL